MKEAIAATIATLATLELRHVPILRSLDARRWTALFNHDDHLPHHWLRKTPGQVRTPGEARVATADTSDTDAVVFTNPVIPGQQEAAATAATVAPPTEPQAGPETGTTPPAKG